MPAVYQVSSSMWIRASQRASMRTLEHLDVSTRLVGGRIEAVLSAGAGLRALAVVETPRPARVILASCATAPPKENAGDEEDQPPQLRPQEEDGDESGDAYHAGDDGGEVRGDDLRDLGGWTGLTGTLAARSRPGPLTRCLILAVAIEHGVRQVFVHVRIELSSRGDSGLYFLAESFRIFTRVWLPIH